MISYIVCSRTANLADKIVKNIATTVGCDYELVVIDNSHKEYNIFTAYEEGVKRAKGDILCFAHDDVVNYHTSNWGVNVERHFAEDDSLGCVGIVGTHFAPNTPFEWYHCLLQSGGCIMTTNGKSENMQYLDHFTDGKTIIEAVVLDGQWMCIRRSLFDKGLIRWDKENFDGWHCYDTDICFQVRNAGYKVGIVADVLIEHTSFGTCTKAWIEATKKVYEKWKHTLPQVAGMQMSEEETKIRTQYIELAMGHFFSVVKATEELKNIRHSHAYQIGKGIVRPIAKMVKSLVCGGIRKVDVVLITYNQANFINEAIEGLLRQNSEVLSIRVIVADDHSTDNTLEIIRTASQTEKGKKLEWLFLPEEQNMGIAANYKRAIAATSADYVAILEGDDYWTDSYRLQKHVDYMSTHADCVITKNQYLQYSQQRKEWGILAKEPQIMVLREIINHYPLANLSATVYRGDVLRNIGDKVFEYGEKQRREATDWYMTLEVIKHGYMYIFDDVMSVYRVDTGDNISRVEKTYQEELDKVKICYEQTLELLGKSYQAECLQIVKRTEDFIQKDKENRRVQQWSKYISPCMAEFMWRTMPKIMSVIKHCGRRLIPNALYKKFKGK